MLNGNVNSLVGDIEALLKDICEFLGNNVNDGFSKEQKSLAEKLINRSKSQLQTIAKFTVDTPESDASYVDMTPKVPPKPIPKYITPTESNTTIELITKDCPYKSMSVLDAKSDNHWGYLERKKTVWFLEHQIKQLAIIVDSWLLIYTSEKDIKPIEFVDLEMTTVKYVNTGDVKCKKQARSFELISPSKNYQFLVKNAKDLDQWITALRKATLILPEQTTIKGNIEINKPYHKSVRKELPPLPQVLSIPNSYMLNENKKHESLETYDAVILTDVDENGENIYETPVHVSSPTPQQSIEKQDLSPPPLPPPLHSKPKYFLHAHNKNSQHPKLSTPEQSIEDDEDEQVDYDLPLNEKIQAERKVSMNQVKNESIEDESDSQEIYDEVITPLAKPALKPNVLQLKSKLDLKPKQKFAGISRTSSYSLRDNPE
ncbi:uncharacterized protein [Onthophagus taurus]|uniref:uncharacterized protein n=1 Tax=Onthophagus taurus TaxID=166361 RepID=UPI0039BE8324